VGIVGRNFVIRFVWSLMVDYSEARVATSYCGGGVRRGSSRTNVRSGIVTPGTTSVASRVVASLFGS
jgi:hypothetical protein